MQRAIPGSGGGCEKLPATKAKSQIVVTQAVDINAGMDGAWYNPATSGQGLLVDSHRDSEGESFLFMAWFTFGESTQSGQRWLTAQGLFEGSTVNVTLYETTGGRFDNPLDTVTSRVGQATLEFEDCSNARLNYSFDNISKSGEIELIRAIPGGEARCEDLAASK